MCKKGNDRNGTKHEDTRSIMPVRRLSASSTSAMTTSTSSLILDDTDAERSALRLVAITTEKANGGDPLAMLDLSNWHYHVQLCQIEITSQKIYIFADDLQWFSTCREHICFTKRSFSTMYHTHPSLALAQLYSTTRFLRTCRRRA